MHDSAIRARGLLNVGAEQSLNKIAEALKKTTSQAERLRISQELFGRGAGFDFARILGNGSAGLDQMMAKAKRFGLDFTTEQAATVQRSNRVWNEFKLGLSGIGRSLAIAFAPIWETIGSKLGDFFAFVSQKVKGVIPVIHSLWEASKEVFAGIGNLFSPLIVIWDNTFGLFYKTVYDFVTQNKDLWRQLWDTTKTVFEAVGTVISVAFNFIKDLVIVWARGMMVIFQPLWDFIKSGFQQMAEALGLSLGSWDDFKQSVIKALITVEFVFKNFGRVIEIGSTSAALQMVNMGLAFYDVFDKVVWGLNKVIDGWNAFANLVGSPVVANIEMPSVNMLGAMARDLERQLAQQGNALGRDLGNFITQKLREINKVAEAAKKQMDDNKRQQNFGSNATENKAGERGSVEAFQIIAGERGDKVFTALNEANGILKQLKDLNSEMARNLRNKINVQLANL